MRDNSIKKLLMSESYFVLNKNLVKSLGIETAFFLTTLIEADDNLADDFGWFYQTVPQIEAITGLTKYKQISCIDTLVSLGIILQENRGIPRKRYFKINYDKIINFLSATNKKIVDYKEDENLTNSSQKTSQPVVEKIDHKEEENLPASSQKTRHNKEYNINNINKEINNKEERLIDTQSLKFKNSFLEYKKIVSSSTGVSLNIIDNLMANILHTLKTRYDIDILIEKIKESDFLMGKKDTKPTTANFSRTALLDRIMADEYKNKDYSKRDEYVPEKFEIDLKVKESNERLYEELGI